MVFLWILLAVVVVVLGYIRLAPSDPVEWHVAPKGDESRDYGRGVLWVIETGPDGLEKLDEIAQSTPRTTVLAGSVSEGLITYVTRTPTMGFPDYASAQQDGNTLKIYSRSRFGRSDFGVNRAKVEGWVDALQAGGQSGG
ncbi:DUF1499 domain-containing protein [Primorskyibacter sp. S87]|uniref:DUF1499 domain-containing protein n=1 Tax=Primorskyibacter sp. S87 TaxID=3415126 RepID=UPI003C7EB60E